jgi:formiminoglutamase
MAGDHPDATEMSENRSWVSIHSLLCAEPDASVAIVGAPLARESITPGRCDLAPDVVRAALKRLSVYDLETETDLTAVNVFDAGNLPVSGLDPLGAFEPVSRSIGQLVRDRALTVVLGGNNAITRPCVHGVDAKLQSVGVLTLDAHFDLRDTDGGLNNGNPIQALLEDGLPGTRISQIGLAPFANTRKAHRKAIAAGISVKTLAECFERGTADIVAEELDRLAKICDSIFVDFDIDVIDRAQMPAAPGARPGGISARDFFQAARLISAHPKVTCVDLTEFDPSTDVNATGALTAARWFAEILAGLSKRNSR